MRKKQAEGALSRHERETIGRSIIEAWERNKRKEHYQGMRKKHTGGCSIDVGQCNDCVIHNEAGRHNLRTNVSTSDGSAPSSTGCEYLSSGQAHSGRTECTHGPSLNNEQVHTEWALLQSMADARSTTYVGHTQFGSVCDSTQQHIHGVCSP